MKWRFCIHLIDIYCMLKSTLRCSWPGSWCSDLIFWIKTVNWMHNYKVLTVNWKYNWSACVCVCVCVCVCRGGGGGVGLSHFSTLLYIVLSCIPLLILQHIGRNSQRWFILSVPNKAECLIFVTLKFENITYLISSDKTLSSEKNDTKIIWFGLVVL